MRPQEGWHVTTRALARDESKVNRRSQQAWAPSECWHVTRGVDWHVTRGGMEAGLSTGKRKETEVDG